jgi:hypothetical protein
MPPRSARQPWARRRSTERRVDARASREPARRLVETRSSKARSHRVRAARPTRVWLDGEHRPAPSTPRLWAARKGGGAGPRVITQQPVPDAVAPASVPKAIAPQHALALEADALQRSLLGDVVDLGRGLEAVDRRRREQVVDELSLRLGSDPTSSMLGVDPDPDLEVSRLSNGSPAHHPDTGPILQRDRQRRAGPADQTVLRPPSLDLPCLGESEPEPLVLAWPGRVRVDPGELRQLGLLYRPQDDRTAHDPSLHRLVERRHRPGDSRCRRREAVSRCQIQSSSHALLCSTRREGWSPGSSRSTTVR